MIIYILNGLPPSYQAFKTAIKTNLQLLSLDDFYLLLCSEEIIQASDASKQECTIQNALLTNCTHGRGRFPTSKIYVAAPLLILF